MTRILLVDDHPVVREGLGRMLTAALPGVMLGEAENSAQAMQAMAAGAWDLVILDLGLPDDDGTVVLKKLRQAYPGIPVLIVSMHPGDQFARRAIHAGAVGYLSKGSAPEELVRAVKTALAGGRHVPSDFDAFSPRDALAMPHELLSDREYQVLRMIGQGRTVSQIAADLSLSVKTVSTYRSRILEKMAMHTNAELMRYVMTHHLAPG